MLLETRLLDTIRDLSFCRDVPSVMAIVRDVARDVTGADGVTFVLREGDHCYYAEENAIAPLWKGRRFPMSACISGWVMRHRQPAVIADIYADPRIPVDTYRPTFVKSLAMVPVRVEDPVAAIGAYWASLRRATDDEVGTLQALANAVALALENARLYDTLRTALERERAAREEAEAASRAKDAFLAIVSHELRTPLTAVLGWARMLNGAAALKPEQVAHGLGVIERNATLQQQLVEDVLDYTNASSNRLVLDCREVDLRTVALSAAAAVASAVESRKIALEVLAEEPVMVMGDAPRLEQVVTGLLSNATKFSEPGGRITLAVARGDGGGQIVVTDEGHGIPPEALPRLFDPFFMVDGSPSRKQGGLGIGLALVERLVALHGGTVTVDSDGPGRGARFTVTVPAAAAPA